MTILHLPTRDQSVDPAREGRRAALAEARKRLNAAVAAHGENSPEHLDAEAAVEAARRAVIGRPWR